MGARAVLIIKSSQFDALIAARVAQFEDELLGKIETVFPRETDRLGDDGMREVVRLGMARAEAHWFSADEDVFAYVALTIMLGAWFDGDPQLPWAAELLIAPGTSEARAKALYAHAMRHLDEVAGEHNEFLIRALLRLRDTPLELLDDVAPEALPDAIVAMLARTYPEKAAAQGEAATRTVVADAIGLAADHGLPQNAGALVFASFALMCGAGFARDPQLPWIAEVLTSDADGETKLAWLYEYAQDFIEFGLS
jgi:hypothetical protein